MLFFLCLTLCLHLRGVVEKKDNFIEKVNVWFIDTCPPARFESFNSLFSHILILESKHIDNVLL